MRKNDVLYSCYLHKLVKFQKGRVDTVFFGVCYNEEKGGILMAMDSGDANINQAEEE